MKGNHEVTKTTKTNISKSDFVTFVSFVVAVV